MAFNNFPYTDAHELNLDWIIKKQKATAIEAEEALKTANEAESKVDNFIENLDVTEAVNDKLDEMYENGDFQDMFDRYQKLTGDVISQGETPMKRSVPLPFSVKTASKRIQTENVTGTQSGQKDSITMDSWTSCGRLRTRSRTRIRLT